jgi:hypothetical protein
MSEKISIVRRLRLEANALGEFQAYASREYQRLLLDAADEIERLGKERDEARREICVMLEDATNNHRENHAKRWGWDCFKDNA